MLIITSLICMDNVKDEFLMILLWKYKIFLLSFNYTSIVLKSVILQINFIPLDVNSGGYY